MDTTQSITYADPTTGLPAAPAQIIDHAPDTLGAPETPTAASRETTNLATSATPDTATEFVAPDHCATLVTLLRAAVEEWIALGEQAITTPYDATLVQLARVLAPPAPRTLDHICGEALMYDYRTAPAAFLSRFDTFGAPRQAAVTHAVAVWLGCEASEVDQLWLETRLRLQDAT